MMACHFHLKLIKSNPQLLGAQNVDLLKRICLAPADYRLDSCRLAIVYLDHPLDMPCPILKVGLLEISFALHNQIQKQLGKSE
jgi:hypothetical protein